MNLRDILGRIENYYTMKYGMDWSEDEKPMSIDQAEAAINALMDERFEKALGEDEKADDAWFEDGKILNELREQARARWREGKDNCD